MLLQVLLKVKQQAFNLRVLPLAAIKHVLRRLAVLVTVQPGPLPLLSGVLCLSITLHSAAAGPQGLVHAALGTCLGDLLFLLVFLFTT